MKNEKLIFYVVKLVAFFFLSFLVIKDHPKLTMIFLIGFIAVLLIWEGRRDFAGKGE